MASAKIFNHNFFSKPNLLNSYWAGFIAADGCIDDTKYSKKLKITLAHKDRNHLFRLKKYINYSGKIYRHQFSVIELVSNKLCEDLRKNFNITPRKSLTLKPPKGLTKRQTLAYIIGYIDGDGYIGVIDNTKRIKILGTKFVLNWIRKQLLQHEKQLTDVKKYDKNVYTFYIYGKKASNITKLLNSIKVPKLKRKWR